MSRAREAALTAFGDDDYVAEALDDVYISSRHWSTVRNVHGRYDEETLIAYAMKQRGCTPAPCPRTGDAD